MVPVAPCMTVNIDGRMEKGVMLKPTGGSVRLLSMHHDEIASGLVLLVGLD